MSDRPETGLDTLLLEASRLSEEGRDAEALDLLLDAEKDNPADATLLCMIGALAGTMGAPGMAVDFFGRCLQQNPTDPRLLITAGAGLAAAGDPAAEPALRLAALSHPELAGARLHYGAYLARSGLVEQGLEELRAARELDPDDPDVRYEIGVALLLDSRKDEALAELEAAVEGSADDSEIRLLWGLALIESGDLTAAAEALHPLGEGMAAEGETQLLLALLFAAEGWDDEAWLALSRAEASAARPDPIAIGEVEEALEAGPDLARELLVEEVAPSALRDRTYLG